MKTQLEKLIIESEEEIRKLRRDKKGNYKQFIKYYEGYIHGLKTQSELKPGDVRNNKIELLEKYSLFLEESGYLDTDWRSEEPFAIDEFLKNNNN